MKLKDIKNLPDETEIKINSVWDINKQELIPVECDGHYDENTKEFYITPSEISVAPVSEEDLRSCAQGVLDIIEDMLDEKDITIPDDNREGNDGEARLFGSTYYDLEDQIVDLLSKL